MIGGQALVALGSARSTDDTDYLVNDPSIKGAFAHDKAANEDYCNAAGNKFFAEIWKMEAKNIGPLASPQALMELKAYALVQHCVNHNFAKADADEFDMMFLARQHGAVLPTIVKKFVTAGEYSEIQAVFTRMRK
jgi:hypothetical protein